MKIESFIFLPQTAINHTKVIVKGDFMEFTIHKCLLGYYRCANPKYPPFCPLDNASFQWEKIDNKDELR